MPTDDFQLEPFEPNKHKELSIFAIGDDYWWIGYDIPSCLQDARENYDVEANEEDCYQLSAAELEIKTFRDEDMPTTRSFKEQFDIEKNIGGDLPRFFACTDW